MKINEIKEEIIQRKLSNGLEVNIHSNIGFKEYYANYLIKYGSNDLDYIVGNEKKESHMGIAHFLEHVMFVTKDGNDYFDIFTKNGASSNAYTSFDQTSYLFSTSVNFEKNLKTLIEQVQTLTINEKNVSKEKGIIEEEIKMYNQRPEFQLQTQMYKNICFSNYKNDIAGDVESINKITKKELYEVYNNFYSPNNSVLFISGPIDDVELLLEKIEKMQIQKRNKVVKLNEKEEKFEIVKEVTNIKSEKVNQDQQIVVFKYPNIINKNDEIKLDITYDILSKYVCSNLNSIYKEYIDSGVINNSLNMYSHIGNDLNIIYLKILGNNKFDLEDFWLKTLANINDDVLNVLVKKKIADEINSFNSVEDIVEGNLNLIIRGIGLEAYYMNVYNITVDELKVNISKLLKNYKKSNLYMEQML